MIDLMDKIEIAAITQLFDVIKLFIVLYLFEYIKKRI